MNVVNRECGKPTSRTSRRLLLRFVAMMPPLRFLKQDLFVGSCLGVVFYLPYETLITPPVGFSELFPVHDDRLHDPVVVFQFVAPCSKRRIGGCFLFGVFPLVSVA